MLYRKANIFSSKIFGNAECENIAPPSQCEMKFALWANFVEKSTCRSKCFFLAPPAGIEPTTSP